jgi:hypothetical protein
MAVVNSSSFGLTDANQKIGKIHRGNMQTLANKSSFLEQNLQLSLLQLTSWPGLPDLLQDTAPSLTRICALLARKPSVGMLIPAMLDMQPQVAYELLETLYAKGHISPVGAVLTPEQADSPRPDSVSSPELPAATASFLGKIWLRLMDRK